MMTLAEQLVYRIDLNSNNDMELSELLCVFSHKGGTGMGSGVMNGDKAKIEKNPLWTEHCH